MGDTDGHTARSAVGGAKQRRLRRIIRRDGHGVLVALDHAAYQGGGPSDVAVAAIAGGPLDAVLTTWHLARVHAEAFADVGLVLRVDGGISELAGQASDDVSDQLYRADEALRLGSDAVITMVFPGAPDEARSLVRLARLCAECEQVGLPVIAEVIPGGWAQAIPWTAENIARGARIAVELGADLVKTVCPTNTEQFAAVCDGCPAPVVALGGPKMPSDDDVVAFARGVVANGAAGIAFGRNVWGSPDPAKLLARLYEAVHA
ncbi:MAG: hypothetical protein E6G60_15755 [Actinobacteria bacterium]|nr:MAG: hypothetical protein E6G60_15755 [Actinomycetota bacterium]